MNNSYERIPKEEFAFQQYDVALHDKKLETKSRGYIADALIRFKKNKSSVVATYILGFLVLFAILAPIISPYSVKTDQDKRYIKTPPYIPEIAELGIGIFDGGFSMSSQNEEGMAYWKGMALETGYDPIIKITGTRVVQGAMYRGQPTIETFYSAKANKYYMIGVTYLTLSYEQYQDLMDYQDEHNIQIIYPYVLTKDIVGANLDNGTAANLWYAHDSRAVPLKDADGNYVYTPIYSTDKSREGMPYTSKMRIAGDDGSYIYSVSKQGSVQCRVCYYNYYQYINGHEPFYIFGTTELGQDMFCAIGVGARFSLLFAVVVAAINLTLGAIIGAIEGYFGGWIDMITERFIDILAGIPFIVSVTLFKIYFAEKVGVLPSFLFAFVLTGWIGMAALTRKQFYRFKGQEYVLAAKTLGASDWRLMFRHIFPNSLGTIITSCVLVIPGVISSETSLTYLGIINLSSSVGTSIGDLMSQGQTAMQTAPFAMLFPALFFSLLLISFNLFGNGLRDAMNPSTRGEA